MIPNIVTLAQAGSHVVPVVADTDAVTIPATRQPSAAGAYFMLFKLCGCGHSSAWHGGAFGDAWRAGEQVRGACESADEPANGACRCTSFRPAD